jgi:hypothetical protein
MAHLFWRENQFVPTKKQCPKESSWFGEPRIRLGTKVQSNSRIQFASNQSKLVPRKLDPGPSSQMGLDKGLKPRIQWNRATLLTESHKLDTSPLKEGPRPKSGKLRLNLHGTILEGKSVGSDPTKDLKRELMSWRTKMQARVEVRDWIP